MLRFDLVALYSACFDLTNLLALHKADPVFQDGTHQRPTAQARQRIKLALGFYVSRPEYLQRLVLGAPRIDLSSQPAGTVSEAEAQNAALMLRGEKPP
ncbi:ProQ/FINO family protein [uncultured Lamprocystis sp.]|uniref:ProQ/FINO family protein n=1 Tax=uncultured Lamprocystis sp. TaxID=543132 RepID=UPI00342CE7D1